jgi:hypothetical protein
MSKRHFASFEEFWPFYVGEHSHPMNRRLHFAGTTAFLAAAAAGLVLRKPKLVLASPLFGYGPAWIGHFFVENNRPATFQHPIWSLRADFRMWWKIATGTMDAEVERVRAEAEARAEPAPQSEKRSTSSGRDQSLN